MAETGRLKVIVGLDLLAAAGTAVEAATLVATALKSELSGVFVEDEALVHAAALPFTSLVRHSGTLSPIDPVRLERALRLAASDARRALDLAAERARLPATFRTARGRLLAQLLAESAERDVIVLGSAVSSARRPRRRGPVVAVFDRAAMGTPLLDIALVIASAGETRLVVVVPSDDDPEPLRAAAAWAEWTPATVQAVDVLAVASIANAVEREHASWLLTSARSDWIKESTLKELREQADCPLVLLR